MGKNFYRIIFFFLAPAGIFRLSPSVILVQAGEPAVLSWLVSGINGTVMVVGSTSNGGSLELQNISCIAPLSGSVSTPRIATFNSVVTDLEESGNYSLVLTGETARPGSTVELIGEGTSHALTTDVHSILV